MENRTHRPQNPNPRQRRASKPKVKTGCNNCKLRRVKCGEERPHCHRCVRSGRDCGGYPAYRKTVDTEIRIAPRPLSNNSSSTSPPSSSSTSPPITPRVVPKKQRSVVRRDPQKPKLAPQVKHVMLPSPAIHTPGGLLFDSQEGQYFQVFRTHTANELSGFFNSEFWTRSVLQESHSEASIRHAVVALGALYKTLDKASESPPSSPTNGYTSDTATNHYNFALQQYAKAITRLRESLQNREARSQRTILISIVLFTCFQSFTGDHKSAIFQIQSGLGMLEERRQDSKQPLVLRKEDVVEDELIQMFTRLAIQAKSYDMAFHFPHPFVIRLSPQSRSDPTSPTSPSSPSDAASNASTEAQIPEVFATLQEARSALDSLQERIMRFNELLSSYHPGPNNILPKSVLALGGGFRMQLAQWGTTFEPLLQARRRPGVSNTERAGIDVLKMMHIMTSILYLMGFSTSEMEFDNFTPMFKEIVELAKEVVVDEELSLAQARCGNISSCRHKEQFRAPDSTHRPRNNYSHIKASFALDLGIVPPLFVVATKCRNRKLRREAISLLISSPRREGMWDSLLCGRVAQWIMEIEEEGMGDREDAVPGENKRVMVKEILFDLQRREANIKCGTRGKREGDFDDRAREAFVDW